MLFCLWLHFDPLYASKDVKYYTSLREEEYVDNSEYSTAQVHSVDCIHFP